MSWVKNRVQGRECGECSVCCVELTIDTDEFKKKYGVPCELLKQGGGCSIHKDASRPKICGDFLCGWRRLDNLPDAMRPDISNVIVTSIDETIAIHSVNDHTKTLTQDSLLDFIVWAIKQDMEICMVFDKPITSDQLYQVPLNKYLRDFAMQEEIPYLEMKLTILKLIGSGTKGVIDLGKIKKNN